MRILEQHESDMYRTKRTYENTLKVAKDKLEKIKAGNKFGYCGSFSIGDYHPLTLIRIVDEDKCLIEVIEKGKPNAEPEIIDTFNLFLVEHDAFENLSQEVHFKLQKSRHLIDNKGNIFKFE